MMNVESLGGLTLGYEEELKSLTLYWYTLTSPNDHQGEISHYIISYVFVSINLSQFLRSFEVLVQFG